MCVFIPNVKWVSTSWLYFYDRFNLHYVRLKATLTSELDLGLLHNQFICIFDWCSVYLLTIPLFFFFLSKSFYKNEIKTIIKNVFIPVIYFSFFFFFLLWQLRRYFHSQLLARTHTKAPRSHSFKYSLMCMVSHEKCFLLCYKVINHFEIR